MERHANLERLRREQFDLAVVGAGINGAAIARDAAMRGLAVALIDKGDFAAETSSRSSKLIHGGLRYLPQLEFRLVRAALRERERLELRTAPHLVRPVRFLLPVYRGRGAGRLALAAGLFVYDLIARTPRKRRHRNLSARDVTTIEPALLTDGLRGGASYYDARCDDARLTLENVLDAAIHRAAVANYAELCGFSRDGSRIAAAAVRDLLADRAPFELRARAFINAAGPWVDHVRRLDDPGAPPCVRLTKGVHVVFERDRLPVRESLVLSDHAGRIIFVIPNDRYVLVGTTDTDYAGDPAAVAADSADVDYLLAVLREHLPSLAPDRRDITSSFAGLRALVRTDASVAPSSVSREEIVLESSSGLVTVAGGKLTTHREIAEKVTDRVVRLIGRALPPCPTRDTPLPGARPLAQSRGHGDDASLRALSPAARDHLTLRYGTRAPLVASFVGERADLAQFVADGCPVVGAEVPYAVRHEMALTLADFIVRRTGVAWRYPGQATSAAHVVARLMASELGWNDAHIDAQVSAFRADLDSRRFG